MNPDYSAISSDAKKDYYKGLIFPILWLALMTSIVITNIIPPQYADYFYMLYFGGFFIYYGFIKRDFSIKIFFTDMRTAVFWKYALLCILLLALAYGVGTIPFMLAPDKNIIFTEFRYTRAYDIPTKIAFFFSAILFPALGQELFYRKAIICFSSKNKLVLSVIIGTLLFAINDNLDLYGLFRSFLVGLAFAIPYVKTRNINIPIFAHYFVSITMTVVFS